jgi:hypothetical protein
MAIDLNPLLASASLLNQGTLYKYSVGAEAPAAIPSWSGFFAAYALSAVGFRTSASVFLQDATSRLSHLPTDEAQLALALNINEKNIEQINQIKQLAIQILSVCRSTKGHDPRVCLVAESLENMASKEIEKQDLLRDAVKPAVVIARGGAEDAFMNCMRSERETLEEMKVKYQAQFDKDAGRLGFSFELQEGGFEDYILPKDDLEEVAHPWNKDLIEGRFRALLERNPDALGVLDLEQDRETQIVAKLGRLKQACQQVVGTFVGGHVINLPHAPQIFKDICPELIFVKLFNLKMKKHQERNFWNAQFKDTKFQFSKDLSTLKVTGRWYISTQLEHQRNPVAFLSASFTLDFLKDELILNPAENLEVGDHATLKDIRDLKLLLTSEDEAYVVSERDL